MTEAIERPQVLPCPLTTDRPDSCTFTVTLPEPDPQYHANWPQSLRRSMYASEHAETWSGEFREHLRAAHTADELLEYVTWEPHLAWSELD